MPAYLRPRVTAAIHREGQTVTLREVVTVIDPDTGSSTTTTLDDDVTALVRGYEESMIDGTVIRARDVEVIVAAEDMADDTVTPDIGPVPKAGWKVLVEGALHHVVHVGTIRMGGLPARYDLHARP